jgi:hypothetical protein
MKRANAWANQLVTKYGLQRWPSRQCGQVKAGFRAKTTCPSRNKISPLGGEKVTAAAPS